MRLATADPERLLVELGADPTIPNSEGCTPLKTRFGNASSETWDPNSPLRKATQSMLRAPPSSTKALRSGFPFR